MDISGIVSIAGMPGLYKILGQTKNGFIAESLIDKKRIPAYSHYKVSTLEDISVFTETEDVPLEEVFQKIADKENYGEAIGHKASETELRAYIESVLPDYDKERVYISDLRKLFSWYNLLQKNDLLKVEKKEEDEQKDKVDVDTSKTKKPGPVNKTAGAAKPVNSNPTVKKTPTVRRAG